VPECGKQEDLPPGNRRHQARRNVVVLKRLGLVPFCIGRDGSELAVTARHARRAMTDFAAPPASIHEFGFFTT
jgi:hypothetical protein